MGFDERRNHLATSLPARRMGAVKATPSQRRHMAHATETGTDKGLGLSVVLGLLAALGAVGMFVGAPDELAAWGFAAAVLFGSLAVVAIHVWD